MITAYIWPNYLRIVAVVVHWYIVQLYQLVENNKMPDITLKVDMTKEPQLRYLVGADPESIFKTKKDTTDLEFEKFLFKIMDL